MTTYCDKLDVRYVLFTKIHFESKKEAYNQDKPNAILNLYLYVPIYNVYLLFRCMLDKHLSKSK